MKIVIEGNPVPKGRPRFAKRGKFISTYTPTKTREYEDLIRMAGKDAMNGLNQFLVPLTVHMDCYMQIPKSTSKKLRQKMLDGEIQHTKKPDLDNMAKCADALNGIVWNDDSQIVRLVLTKQYSDYPRLEITVTEHKPN